MVRNVRDKDGGPTSPPATHFRVGDVEVAPETGAVSGPGGHATLDPKVMSVLACLAAARGRLVTRDRIMERAWPGVVVTDFALSRCIYQLRKTLGEVSAASSSPIETLPKRGYRLAWKVTDSPPVPQDLGDTRTMPPSNSAWVVVLSAVVLVAALYAYGSSRHWFGVSSSDRSVRVSVLPLEDLSPDDEQAIFVKGLTREIMHEVAAIPGVVAIGQQSVFEPVVAGSPLLKTAERLDADFVISGNVTPVGDARRVLIDLRSVPTGELLWSHSYLVERDAPFILVPAVAQSVAAVLDLSANPGRVRGFTQNLAAFEAYVAAGEAESREAVRQLLLRAVELDPEFAEAWEQLAGIEVLPVWNGQTTVDEAWGRAKPCLDRVFELDPDLPSAHVTLGRFRREFGDMDGAIASFRKALDLDPGNSWASANLGLVLRFTGRYAEALAIHDMAVAMDPLSPAAQTRLGTSYWFVGDFESAERHYRTAIDLDPTFEEVYDSWSGMLGAGLGRYDEALKMIQRKMSLSGEPTARSLAAAGGICSILGLDSAALGYWQRAEDVNPAYRRIDEERLRHYLARGDDAAVRRIATAILETDSENDDAVLALGIIDLERGDAEAFARRVRGAYPAYFEGQVEVQADTSKRALLVALTYSIEGREKAEQSMLHEVEKAIESPRAWQYVVLAATHAMSGHPDEALKYLNSSPPGRVRGWAAVLMRDPRFASLRDKDEFRALVGGHLEEIRLQGSRISDDLAMR